MKIGCIGSGSMTTALATQWANKGHEIVIGGRTPTKTEALAKEIGINVKPGSIHTAAAFGDVVLLAVRHEGVMDTLASIGAADGSLAGKVLIDCNNAVAVDGKKISLKVGFTTSFAEQIAEAAPGAKVVKAFNMCQAKVWAMTPPIFDDRPLVVPICGDDAEANKIVARLISDIGCEPLDFGELSQARLIEPAGAMVIHLLFNGHDAKTIMNVIMPRS